MTHYGVPIPSQDQEFYRNLIAGMQLAGVKKFRLDNGYDAAFIATVGFAREIAPSHVPRLPSAEDLVTIGIDRGIMELDGCGVEAWPYLSDRVANHFLAESADAALFRILGHYMRRKLLDPK